MLGRRLLRVNYCSRNQRSVRLKSTESRDSDKKSRRYYEGGDTVSGPRVLLPSLSDPTRTVARSCSRSFILPPRETDGGLYYTDSYYHQLNSYTISGPWCSYVIPGDARRVGTWAHSTAIYPKSYIGWPSYKPVLAEWTKAQARLLSLLFGIIIFRERM